MILSLFDNIAINCLWHYHKFTQGSCCYCATLHIPLLNPPHHPPAGISTLLLDVLLGWSSQLPGYKNWFMKIRKHKLHTWWLSSLTGFPKMTKHTGFRVNTSSSLWDRRTLHIKKYTNIGCLFRRIPLHTVQWKAMHVEKHTPKLASFPGLPCFLFFGLRSV